MTDSPVQIFERLVSGEPPTGPRRLFGTATVLGGSLAGLLAARVLADHADAVVIVERDDVSVAGPRPGTPQDQQVHTLLPGGRQWIERWLPGVTAALLARGAGLADPASTSTTLDGHRQVDGGAGHRLLAAGRPLLEGTIRAHVLALPNVSVVTGRAQGLRYRDGAVSAVVCADGELSTEFVVDAMGRSSRLADWLGRDGYDKPPMERLAAPINYATAVFERADADPEITTALSLTSPGNAIEGVSVAAVNAIEDRRWMVMLMGYGDERPGRTVEEIRKISTALPPIYAEATAGAVVRDVVTYHQAESRRRDFTAVENFPAGLVAAGDAVASYNPIHGQGMSSAALHASALSAYLSDFAPGIARPFFDLQKVVVDAAWAVSAGDDAARLDALTGAPVPPEVRAQREALQDIIAATLSDPAAARKFHDVAYMLRHPATLG